MIDCTVEVEGELDSVLSEISELKVCTRNPGRKVYYLRPGLEQEYSVFFYGYSREQQTAAQEYQLSSRLNYQLNPVNIGNTERINY